jgi:uncharacterized protein (DUF2461 family)
MSRHSQPNPFGPGLFRYLRALRRNNNRNWFQARKDEYEAEVREAIVNDPRGWKRVRDGKRFRDLWTPGGASLKRAPRGYDESHEMIEDLRRTDHIAFCELSDSEIVAANLVTEVTSRFRRAARYLRWQAEALGLPF